MFKIIKKDKKTKKRVGSLKTKSGVVKTPFFMPIATKGAVKSLTPEELKTLGAQIVLGNTYHLWLRPGMEIIKRADDLHGFMNWFGPILTDSGGYQVFSLGKKISNKQLTINNKIRQNGVKISDAGVEFRDPIDGKKYWLTPEKSIEIQLALGGDIIMVLDECPAFPSTPAQMEKTVARTTAWAKRCKEYFEKKTKSTPTFLYQRREEESEIGKRREAGQFPPFRKGRLGGIYRPLLFGIIQGGIYKDLRQRSARELMGIGFDGYAIGGVAVGEPRKYLTTVLEAVMPLLPENKPRYLMGLGKPEEIVAAVNAGIDMFDCVIPTREARHGKLYIYSSTKSRRKVGTRGEDSSLFDRLRVNFARTIKPDFYETINILNAKFAKDFSPIDKHCACYPSKNYPRAFLRLLFKPGEPLSLRLATIHNLKLYLGWMEGLRGF